MKNFKNLTKRTLALLLALAMCVGMLQLTAFAEDLENAEAPAVISDAAGVEETEAEDEDIAALPEEEGTETEDAAVLTEEEAETEDAVIPAEEESEDETEAEDETGYTVVWNWGYTGAPDEGVYAAQTASELDENGRPVIDDPEAPVRQDYLFMYWTDFEQAEDGSYVTTAKWEKDVKVDPTVPESERSEWGDNIPDSWQITVCYYVNNGSFSFEGQDGLRCTLTNLHSDTGPACKTVVTARDDNGNPTKWYDGCTATLAAEHLPTGVPDEGYSKGTWYYSDYYVYGDPAVGSAINPGSSSVTMRLVYSDPSTKVTVTYQHNTSKFSWGKWAFENKDQWETLFTVELDKGEWYETWKPGKISNDYDVGGWTPNRQVDDITPNSPFGLHEGWHYSITEDLVLRVCPTIKSSGSGTVGVCPSPNVTYEWGAVTPRVGSLPYKIGYYEGVTVGIANGPSGIVTGTDGKQYLFKGWKLTSGSVASAVPESGIVARSLTLSNEDIVLTAQWEAYEEAKVLVQWLAGYPGAQPGVIQVAQVDKSDVWEWNNGDIDLFGVDYPANPERSGYKFTGWGKPVKNADGSITITAQWIEHTHSYTSEVTTDPTCTEDGVRTYTCECGDTYTRPIDATGHKWGEWEVTTPATCEGDGVETRVCENDPSHTETRPIDASGHDWGEWEVTTPATCEGDGVETRVCENDPSHTETRPIDATGHDWKAKDEGEDGHSWVCDNDPTHTKPAEDHTYGDEWNVTRQPNCTEAGEKEHFCTECGHRETQPIEKLGHDWGEWTVTTSATCEDDGVETRVCSRDASHIETRPIKASGHDWGDWEVTTEPTCEGEGEETRVCKNDPDHTETKPIDPTGHDWKVKDEGEDGHSWVCDNDPTHTKPAEDHTYGDEWNTTKQPTCTEAGEKEHFCTECGHRETQPIDKLGHDWGNWTVTTPATCEDDGVETRVCSRDANHIETRPIKATGHNYGDWEVTTPATCEGEGEETRVCENDPSHTETRPVDPTGHDYGEWVTTKEPTETEPGEKERECDKCGHKETEEIPATGEKEPEESKEPETPAPTVPVIVIIPEPSEEPTPSESPAPSEEPDDTDISDEQPPMGELPGEPGEDIADEQPPMGGEPDEAGEDISDEQPPMGELPEEPGEDIADAQPPMGGEPDEAGEDISDEQPPMSGEPDEDISDATPPLADVPQTGEASTTLWAAATLLAGAGLVFVNTGKRKKEEQ